MMLLLKDDVYGLFSFKDASEGNLVKKKKQELYLVIQYFLLLGTYRYKTFQYNWRREFVSPVITASLKQERKRTKFCPLWSYDFFFCCFLHWRGSCKKFRWLRDQKILLQLRDISIAPLQSVMVITFTTLIMYVSVGCKPVFNRDSIL